MAAPCWWLAKSGAKTSVADCPYGNRSGASPISFSISAGPCCRPAAPRGLLGCARPFLVLGDGASPGKGQNAYAPQTRPQWVLRAVAVRLSYSSSPNGPGLS